MTAQQLRNKWLEFFKSKGHTIIPSASLIPENDPSVLFTMAGMFPLVPYLMGQEHPGGNRVANVQKCIRTIDIDEVGDDTHLTFFEMLGNWSFGDYFKKEAIQWSYDFLINVETGLGLDPNRIAVSVFRSTSSDRLPSDVVSPKIWQSYGMPEDRIAYLGEEDNWWIAGAIGPCGPDTEMFYWIDDGNEPLLPFQKHHDDPRWVEIWNDVFMEYEKLPDGSIVPLKQRNVDTGMGLDRTLAVLNGQRSFYDTELFKKMFDVLAIDQAIMTNDEIRKARIIVDHVRAAVFIAGDGVEPSNKERGYILRRLLRRSMVYGRLLNLQGDWLKKLIEVVASEYEEAYPELRERLESISKVILDEKEKFSRTLEKGLKEFEKYYQAGIISSRGSYADLPKKMRGRVAFDLFATYGFPRELIEELAKSLGIEVDWIDFDEEFKKHQELSRTASAGIFKGGLANTSPEVVRYHTTTHLMHQALRTVLGPEVWQKGSNINEERTRFDFTYPTKMTDEQKKQVEDLVNDWIARDAVVTQEMMPLARARELGAIGLFGEKYADTVSIYTITDPKTGEVISREFCGGPHVEHTAQIAGTFKIKKEEAVSAGMRRVKGILV